MKIDVDDGTISFEHGEISRKLDRAGFLETNIGGTAQGRLVNEGWWHFSIDPEDDVAGTVIFNVDVIDRIFLMIRMSSDKAQEWSVERELERKVLHDRWLHSQLGDPPYEYAWGRVASEFDPKGLASEIIVVYDH